MENDLESDLAELLSEDISGLKMRETATFDRLAAPLEASLVPFGAGKLGPRTLKRFTSGRHRATGLCR